MPERSSQINNRHEEFSSIDSSLLRPRSISVPNPKLSAKNLNDFSFSPHSACSVRVRSHGDDPGGKSGFPIGDTSDSNEPHPAYLRIDAARDIRDGSRRIESCQQEFIYPVYDEPLPELKPRHVSDVHNTDWKTDIAKPTASLYALLIIISNISLSVSSQARHDNRIPITYSKWFDAVLYGLSILFLLYAMAFLFDDGSVSKNKKIPWSFLFGKKSTKTCNDINSSDGRLKNECSKVSYQHSSRSSMGRAKSSVYLKINAIICGVGAMIFSCLEFGVWISNRQCYDTIVGIISIMVIVYVSVQTYFIFLYSKRIIQRQRILSCFGLMHLVATDLTIWLRVLIDQTLYEFAIYRSSQQEQNSSTAHISSMANDFAFTLHHAVHQPAHNVNSEYVTKGIINADDLLPLSSPACQHSKSMLGDVLVNASVFLYPCIIGYAVISAGIIYIMSRNMASAQHVRPNLTTEICTLNMQSRLPVHSRHSCHSDHCNCHISRAQPQIAGQGEMRVHRLYWLDCDQAVGGLLNGSIVLAMTIVCLILFFIFKKRNPELAMLEVQIGETVLYCLGIGATAVAFIQIARNLPKNPGGHVSWELDSSMLLVSVVGVYAFSVLSIIGATDDTDTPGVPVNTILMIVTQTLAIVQATFQTIYIFEASHRSMPQSNYDCNSDSMQTGLSPEGKVQKPGRNALTFLIVINLAFWNMNIFKTLRSEASPTQREFFGVYEWTIITHVTVPLTLLYRFHSAAGLFEIWKHAYRVKQPRSLVSHSKGHLHAERTTSILPINRNPFHHSEFNQDLPGYLNPCLIHPHHPTSKHSFYPNLPPAELQPKEKGHNLSLYLDDPCYHNAQVTGSAASLNCILKREDNNFASRL